MGVASDTGNTASDSKLSAIIRSSIEPCAFEALSIIESAGFEGWIVGGAVRDAILSRPGNDVDIASNARWNDTKLIFEAAGWKTRETGVSHGTITVIKDSNAIEVTTYRTDGSYSDNRRPDGVSFVRTIEEDLARRDFTVNAIAWNPRKGVADPFDGLSDLQAKKIRAVGDPRKRFDEDALRILRGCRFRSQLGFSIEKDTFQAMMERKHLLFTLSSERITHEVTGFLCGDYAGDALLETVDVLSAVLPELVAMKGFKQRTPYHIYDVLGHTARVIDGVPAKPLVRWAALFHDTGKPATFFVDENGQGHFYGHAKVSVMHTRNALERFSFSRAFGTKLIELVKRHDDPVAATQKAVRRAIYRLGGDIDLFRVLCDLKRGDARGQAPRCAGRIGLADELASIADDVEREGQAVDYRKLAVNGNDLAGAGIPRGPMMGSILKELLEAVIDENVENEREQLLARAKEFAVELQR